MENEKGAIGLAVLKRGLNETASGVHGNALGVRLIGEALKERFGHSNVTIGEATGALFEFHEFSSEQLRTVKKDLDGKRKILRKQMESCPEAGPNFGRFLKSLDDVIGSYESNLRTVRTALYLCLGYMERGMEGFPLSKIYQGLELLRISDDFRPSNRRIPGRIVIDVESSHIPTNTVVSEDFSDTREFRRYFLVQPGNGSCPVRCVAYDTGIDLSLQRLMLSRRELPENMHGDIGEVMKNYTGTLSRVVKTRKSGGVGYFAKTSRELCQELNGLMLEKRFVMPYPNPADTVVTQDVLYV